MSEKNSPSPKSGGDGSDVRDSRTSLDRLADFTRRIVAVPKSEIPPPGARPKEAERAGVITPLRAAPG